MSNNINNNKVFGGFKSIIQTVYDNSPEQVKDFFFQNQTKINNREELIKNIQYSLFNKL